jgi:predicted nucleic acid-binding protein
VSAPALDWADGDYGLTAAVLARREDERCTPDLLIAAAASENS